MVLFGVSVILVAVGLSQISYFHYESALAYFAFAALVFGATIRVLPAARTTVDQEERAVRRAAARTSMIVGAMLFAGGAFVAFVLGSTGLLFLVPTLAVIVAVVLVIALLLFSNGMRVR
ncbi:MAG: hypothetical protein ACJ757_17965 [Gaiellaceae bacterium]